MLEKIKAWYKEFKRDWRGAVRTLKRAISVTGVIGAISAAFAGHVFLAIVIAGMTYIFWRNPKGGDELVGTA